jgi:hypothetical protein
VAASAAAACWSPRAAAAWVRDKLMVPPFAAKAESGSSAAITMHKTKRIDASPFSVFTLTHKGISRMQRPARTVKGSQ